EYAWSASLLQDAARQISNRVELLYDLAWANYSIGRIQEADSTLKQYLSADLPDAARQPAERFAEMISVALNPEKAAEALPKAQEILAKDPDYVPALMVTALVQEQKGQYRDAQKVYEKILFKNSVFAAASRQLAMIYGEQLGEDQKAEELATR